MSYQWELQIGDWSDDGHGKTKDYIIESNHSVEVAREAYFKAKKKLKGFDFGEEVCSGYEQYRIEPPLFEKMLSLGFSFDDMDPEDLELAKVEGLGLSTKDITKLFLQYLKMGDPTLELDIVPEPQVPTFHFYGFDKKKRHIPHIGYGLFD